MSCSCDRDRASAQSCDSIRSGCTWGGHYCGRLCARVDTSREGRWVKSTASYYPRISIGFLLPPVQVFPSAQYYKRAGFPLKKICQYAAARGFTDVLVANEDRKSVNGLLLIHLPGGPTAHFRLSKLVLSKDIKVGGAAAPEYHLAECGI